MRYNLSIKEEYKDVIENILKLKPHLKRTAVVVEIALDNYLDKLKGEGKK